MALNMFIDANIYLDFYHYVNDDLVELEKLVELIKNSKVTLLSTPQLEDEVYRNRENKLAEALKKFDDQVFKCQAPVFIRKHSEFKELQDLLIKANKKHSELREIARQGVLSNGLPTDKLIEKLLSSALKLDGKSKAYNSALDRFRKGNPPGKKSNTIGDELNWEHLLLEYNEDCDLHFVSGDSDFASKLNPTALNTFLATEWKKKKNSKIVFYKSLSQFCLAHFPNIKLASDVEISMAIEKLSMSSSFTSTHIAISALQKLDEFSKEQASQLAEIAILNNQVSWIIDDDDVRVFYEALLNKHEKHLPVELASKLKSKLVKAKDNDFAEVPF